MQILILYFKFSEYERRLRMTVVGFISSIGGLFGLCLGFSLVSLYEIFYWFVVKLGRRIIQR